MTTFIWQDISFDLSPAFRHMMIIEDESGDFKTSDAGSQTDPNAASALYKEAEKTDDNTVGECARRGIEFSLTRWGHAGCKVMFFVTRVTVKGLWDFIDGFVLVFLASFANYFGSVLTPPL